MSKKKILALALILGAAVVFSGCGKPPIVKYEANDSSQTQTEETLPEPTGKVDDIVDAALSDVEGETVEMEQEEDDAAASLDDSQETNDFGQSYDESEF